MAFCRRLLRKKQSKGYGVHSPFAFNLITKILFSPHSYYAFTDILEVVKDDPERRSNQVIFRLINHFKPSNVLEINSGKGVGSLYILAPSSKINCTFVERNQENITLAKENVDNFYYIRNRYLNSEKSLGSVTNLENLSEVSAVNEFITPEFVPSLKTVQQKKYGAMVINLDMKDNHLYLLERLFELSDDNTFWVIKHINKKPNKQLWFNIVNDARINITFDIKNRMGVAFLRSAYHKQHYYV